MPAPSVILADASFHWPDGATVLDHVSAAFGPCRTGLVGDNGAGKSTLLRLVARELELTGGSLATVGDVAHLRQDLVLGTHATVADLLGITPIRRAIRAIEGGSTDPAHYDAVGDGWDIDSLAVAELGALGLPLGLERPVGTLSGGETMLVALSGLRLGGAGVVLLDEPTNNLDRGSRERLQDVVRNWRGSLLVVSHDVELLDLMDDTAELRRGSLTVFGGGFTEFREALEREQDAARQALRTATQSLRTEERQRREAEQKLASRLRKGRKDYANRRLPKVVANTRRLEAQESAGRLRGHLDDRLDRARERVDEVVAKVRDEDRVRVRLPDPDVPAGRRLLELHGESGTHTVMGPERVAITGPNGIGKTRLLETLFDPDLRARAAVGATPLTTRIGYLPQRLDGLDGAASAVDNVADAAPTRLPGELRAELARFLLRGATAERAVDTLSGGERFRVALARLLLADPPHHLLVLDEPTNNLDLSTRQALVDALTAYRGALLVVSHDRRFLADVGVDYEVVLTGPGSFDVETKGTVA